MGLITTPKDLNSLVANMLHDMSCKQNYNPLMPIRFSRIMRGLSEEIMANRLGLSYDYYMIFENEIKNYPNRESLPYLLDGAAKILGCSYEFICGYSQYVYDNRSADLTQDEYDRICITKEFVRDRINQIISIDNLNKEEIFKEFKIKRLSMLENGTKDLVFIKEVSKI